MEEDGFKAAGSRKVLRKKSWSNICFAEAERFAETKKIGCEKLEDALAHRRVSWKGLLCHKIFHRMITTAQMLAMAVATVKGTYFYCFIFHMRYSLIS